MLILFHSLVQINLFARNTPEQFDAPNGSALLEAVDGWHRDEWLDHRKVSKQIVGYANIGEIGFRWTEQEKDVIQQLWWWNPDHPERPTQATEYRDTLLIPVHDAAPPLP